MFARHLEPDEFMNALIQTPCKIMHHLICLDNGIAGIVYGFEQKGVFYYLDRFFPSKFKESCLQKMNRYDLHKELYVKMNLKVHLISMQ